MKVKVTGVADVKIRGGVTQRYRPDGPNKGVYDVTQKIGEQLIAQKKAEPVKASAEKEKANA